MKKRVQQHKQLTEMQLKQKLLKSSDYDEQFAAMHEKLRQMGARFYP